MPAIRSDSLWRSSPAPRKTDVPSATAAARPAPGSRRSPPPCRRATGRRPGAGSTARRGRRGARRSASPGGLAVALLDRGAHPPQEVDDGTPGRVDAHAARRSSASGWIAAGHEPEGGRRRVGRDASRSIAAGQDRAVEPHGVRAVGPGRLLARRRRARGASAPCGRGSRRPRSPPSRPRRARPASRIADLTWALRDRRVERIGVRRARPITGAAGACRRPGPRTPRPSRAAARRCGPSGGGGARRRRRGRRTAAGRRGRRRRAAGVVPELPQSRTPAGSRSASPPGETTR